MTTDITELAQSLKAAAEKATPGRWEYYPGNTSIEYNVDSMDEDQGSIVYVDSGDFTQAQTDRNGEFIALANPANVLALVEALEKVQTKAVEQGRTACELFDEVTTLRQRIAELESRTVTVKLPSLNPAMFNGDVMFGYRKAQKEAVEFCSAAGIKVEVESWA
ncbi:TPA: ead/Ea22-like family protein [Klebsiella aerogenes]